MSVVLQDPLPAIIQLYKYDRNNFSSAIKRNKRANKNNKANKNNDIYIYIYHTIKALVVLQDALASKCLCTTTERRCKCSSSSAILGTGF